MWSPICEIINFGSDKDNNEQDKDKKEESEEK